MGCLLWVQSLICILHLSLSHCCVQYPIIFDHSILGHNCICVSNYYLEIHNLWNWWFVNIEWQWRFVIIKQFQFLLWQSQVYTGLDIIIISISWQFRGKCVGNWGIVWALHAVSFLIMWYHQAFLIAWNTSWPAQKHYYMICTTKQICYPSDCYKDVSFPVWSQDNFMFIMGIPNLNTSHSYHGFSHVSNIHANTSIYLTVYMLWNCNIGLIMFLRALGMLIKGHWKSPFQCGCEVSYSWHHQHKERPSQTLEEYWLLPCWGSSSILWPLGLAVSV